MIVRAIKWFTSFFASPSDDQQQVDEPTSDVGEEAEAQHQQVEESKEPVA